MRHRSVCALALITLVLAPTVLGEVAAEHERRLTRLVGTPSPAGPVRAASDQASYRVDVPPGVMVVVEARAGPNSAFYLRAHPLGTNEPVGTLPATHAAHLLTEPGPWRVTIDPAGGAAVNVRVSFRGHVSDLDGAPAAFSVTDLERDDACVVPGVCLP